MLGKIISRLVKFQSETVEDINWKRIRGQLSWMNKFSKGYRGRLGILVGLGILMVLIGVAYAIIYREVIDRIMGDIQNIIAMVERMASEMRYESLWAKFVYVYEFLISIVPISLFWIAAGYILYKIIMYVYSLFMAFFTLKLRVDLGLGIKRQVYGTILESDWLALTKYHSGDLVQRVSSDADTISGFAMDTVPSMIVQVVQFFVVLGVVAFRDWRLIVVAMLSIPVWLFTIWLTGRRKRYYSRVSLELNAKNSSFLYESMANIMVIKSFMLVPQFIRRYREIHKEMYSLTVEMKKYGIVTSAITGALGKVLGGAIFVFFVVQLIDGKMTFGDITSFGMLAGMLTKPVTSILGFAMGAIEISASAERVMTIYELPRDRTQVPEVVAAYREKADVDGLGLRVENLSFSYIPGKQVLRDVNITVNHGETVAFVGPSGEGKTTLIRLALGLMTPDQGRAYLSTGKGDTLGLSVETRDFFSYVPQGNTMFSGTVRENMLMGDPTASDERIITALKQACIYSFVEAQPTGLETPIGERGVGISEGQAQRLAIARALLRGAPILLLDEATSALDIYTEKEVLDNIFNSGICKTCVLTTHRPSVFTVCDKIYRVRDRTVELIKESRDQEVNF